MRIRFLDVMPSHPLEKIGADQLMANGVNAGERFLKSICDALGVNGKLLGGRAGGGGANSV